MARSLFGGSDDDWVARKVGNFVAPQANATVTFWSAKSGGSQYTDLLDAAGSATTSIITDGDGFVPQFSGPDGVTEMWADAGAGKRVKIQSRDVASMTFGPRLSIGTVATASGPLVPDQHNPVDASGANRSMTLADASGGGRFVILEKTDPTTNTVTVTGKIRGVAGTTLTLYWQNESLMLVSKSDGSWWPVAGHKTKTSLDAFYSARRSTIDRTYFVSTAGDDNNDGLSEGKAFKTFAKGISMQPGVTQTFNSTRRTTRLVNSGGGDFHETVPLVANKAANLEIVGAGGRGGAGVGIYGGTTIYTPIGSVGLTIGYRDDTDTSWLNAKGGCKLTNLQVRPDGTDTGSSTGIKIIGLSNCEFTNVAVCDYQGTGSVNWHMQSAAIANGGSGGGTMYNEWRGCTSSRGAIALKSEGAYCRWYGGLIDGQDDIVSSYLAGSTGVQLTSGAGLTAFGTFFQAYETAIDDSQSHGAGVVYSVQLYGCRWEACKTGVISNQLETVIKGGSFYSGGLSGGTTGTIAFDMRAGAEFSVEDVSISGVETPVAVTSGASGYRRDPATGTSVWGTKLRGVVPGKYIGTATTSSSSTGGVPTVTLNASAGTSPTLVGSMGTANGLDTGSTDMQGRVVWTAGTSPGAGSQATVTFATAFASGVKPIVALNHETAGTNTVVNAISITNSAFQINFNATPGAGTHTVSYAIVGFTQ